MTQGLPLFKNNKTKTKKRKGKQIDLFNTLEILFKRSTIRNPAIKKLI